MPGKLFVLTGPSGVGKSSVASELLNRRNNLKKVITTTTRPSRENEVDGVDYHFVDEATFQNLIDDNQMFEWARVYDYFYGSQKKDVDSLLESGSDVLMVIDAQGAKTIMQNHPEATAIFLNAESKEVLLERLSKRDKGETINLEERIAALHEEMAFCDECHHNVVNLEGKMLETVEKVTNIMDAT